MNTAGQAGSATSNVLVDEVAIVTGGGGIGRAVAHRLATAGARVGVFDANGEAAEQVAREIGDAAVAVAGDCTDAVAVDAAVRSVGDRLGPVTVLVQAAGIATPCPAVRLDRGAWSRTLDVNLHGAYNFLEACVPGMLERGHGRIVNIASISGHRAEASARPLPTPPRRVGCWPSAGQWGSSSGLMASR